MVTTTARKTANSIPDSRIVSITGEGNVGDNQSVKIKQTTQFLNVSANCTKYTVALL